MAVAEKELVVKAGRGTGPATMALTFEGEQVEVPADILAKAQKVIDRHTANLTARANAYLERVEEAKSSDNGQGIGAVTVGPYVGFDIVVLSPMQFIGPPPYLPHKIVAGGELVLALAYMWTNPAVDIPNGFATPASQQLGLRDYRVRFEQIDLSRVVNGPDFQIDGTFGAPAAMLTPLPFWFVAPDPGSRPRLMELNVTADIRTPVQPWAAFATNHYELDEDPAFLGIPSSSPGWRHGQPLRYLVYRD